MGKFGTLSTPVSFLASQNDVTDVVLQLKCKKIINLNLVQLAHDGTQSLYIYLFISRTELPGVVQPRSPGFNIGNKDIKI